MENRFAESCRSFPEYMFEPVKIVDAKGSTGDDGRRTLEIQSEQTV